MRQGAGSGAVGAGTGAGAVGGGAGGFSPDTSFPPADSAEAPDFSTADEELPTVVRVVGRGNLRENSDLCGEYRLIGTHHGRAAYRKLGTCTVIRYWSTDDRWLIDREGLQESDNCNAYADPPGSWHPAHEELFWHIWETSAGRHVADPEFLVTPAPESIQVIGRATGKENAAMNGEYTLLGLHQGKVAYQKKGTRHTIRYWSRTDRWLIDMDGMRHLDVCNAWADARGTRHPGNPSLCWHIWDTDKKRHTVDIQVQCLVAPRVVELVGRDGLKENASMNGSYVLVGMHEGRPAYQKPGMGHAIRYWPPEDRWLVDLEGLREVDLCNAYADARGKDHPGDPGLVWHAWETSRGRHIADHAVRALVVPQIMSVYGREPTKENHGINGEYRIFGLQEGLPEYRKPGTSHVIRYWPPEDRWLIDLEGGRRGLDVANAYADAHGTEHPGEKALIWHVWETSRGRHIADEDVKAASVDTYPASATGADAALSPSRDTPGKAFEGGG